MPGPNDTQPRGDGSDGDDGLTSGTKLAFVVGGLIAVALAIGVLTVLYWRHTRPYDDEGEWADEADGAVRPDSEPTTPIADPGRAVGAGADPNAANAAILAQAFAPLDDLGPPTVAVAPVEPASSAPGDAGAAGAAAVGPAAVLEPAPVPIVTLEDLAPAADQGAAPGADGDGEPAGD